MGLGSSQGEAAREIRMAPIAGLALLAAVRRNCIQRLIDKATSVAIAGLDSAQRKVAKEIRIKEPITRRVPPGSAR